MTDKPDLPPVDSLSYEQALAALEQIVTTLEQGEAPLEESIALYERGAALRKHCEKKLAAAELRVTQIAEGPDGPEAKPFAHE